MRLVHGGFRSIGPVPAGKTSLSLRPAPMRVHGTCRECWKEIPFIQSSRRSQATLCRTCIGRVLRVLPPMHCSRY